MGINEAKKFLFDQFNKSAKENNIPTIDNHEYVKDITYEDEAFHVSTGEGDITVDPNPPSLSIDNTFRLVGRKLKSDLLNSTGNNGEICVTSDTNEIFIWVDDAWLKADNYCPLDDVPKRKRTKKIIPYPSHCKSCGSPLHGYVCNYCHTEYPSFEYIIEEEEY